MVYILLIQDCIRLHMDPLARSIKQHAKDWIKCYGDVLYDSAKTGLFSLKRELEVNAHTFLPLLKSEEFEYSRYLLSHPNRATFKSLVSTKMPK